MITFGAGTCSLCEQPAHVMRSAHPGPHGPISICLRCARRAVAALAASSTELSPEGD
jgi:hypothetical protein